MHDATRVTLDGPADVLACVSGHAAAGTGLKTVRLVPDGATTSAHGVSFLLDAQAADLVLKAFKEHGADVVVDYEHESLGGDYARPGVRAKAAGWIKSMHYEPGTGKGIFGLVEWTPVARDAIRAGEFRYLSPVVFIRKSDRRVVAIESCAVTNKPALPRMEALAASRSTRTESEGTMEGNQATGSGQQAEAEKPTTETPKAETPNTDAAAADQAVACAVRKQLGLPADASADAVVVALAAKQTADSEALNLKQREREADELVAEVVRGNKLPPYNTEALAAARRLAADSPETFTAIFAAVTPIVPPGRTTPPSGRTILRNQVINEAEGTYRSESHLKALCSKRAFVSDALKQKGLPELSDDEAAMLAVL